MRTATIPTRTAIPTARLAVLLLALTLGVACSALPGEDPVRADDTDVEVTEGLAADDVTADEPAGSDEPESVPPVADVPVGPPRPELGVPEVLVTSPPSGQGPRPLLAWEPVEGAVTYAVMVYVGPGEAARWSWRGTATSVRVGFVEDPTVGGPNIIEGMTWSVLALDADDEPVAQSSEWALAP